MSLASTLKVAVWYVCLFIIFVNSDRGNVEVRQGRYQPVFVGGVEGSYFCGEGMRVCHSIGSVNGIFGGCLQHVSEGGRFVVALTVVQAKGKHVIV
jgi:hypothetical protein